MTPYISIIVPCYGVEKYLNKCVNSLVNQTLRDIEIIMIDDESPDNVPQMCDDWARKDSRITVVHKKNGGLGLARNSGLEVATGEYVAFVDSDDFVDEHMYEKLLLLAEKENADACFCGYSYYDGNNINDVLEGIAQDTKFIGRNEVDNFLFSMIGLPPEDARDTLINMCVWRAIYRRRIIQEHHVRFVSERIAASEDVTFHAFFLPLAEKVCFITEHLYRYRFNPQSISHSYPEWKRKSLLGSCSLIGEIFAKKYSKEYYINCYRRHLFRNLKTIIRKEAQRKTSLSEKIKEIKSRLNNPVFADLFVEEYDSQKLPIAQRIIYFLCKYKCVLILILLIKITRK